jgi:hypothetical protein
MVNVYTVSHYQRQTLIPQRGFDDEQLRTSSQLSFWQRPTAEAFLQLDLAQVFIKGD